MNQTQCPNFVLRITVPIWIAIIASGCGPASIEDLDASEDESTSCSQTLINDYNQIFSQKAELSTFADVDQFVELVTQFKNEHGGEVCDAQYKMWSTRTEVRVDEEVEEWMRAAGHARNRIVTEAALKPGTASAYDGTSRNCSSLLIGDYNSWMSGTRLAVGPGNVVTSKRLLEEFETEYRGVRCYANVSQNSFSGEDKLIVIDDEIKKVREVLQLIESQAQKT